MLKVVCAWCGKHLRGSETADEVSHGICASCQATIVIDNHTQGGPNERSQMAIQERPVTWVVYLMTIHKRTDRYLAVCEQSEWDAMERSSISLFAAESRPRSKPKCSLAINRRRRRETPLTARFALGLVPHNRGIQRYIVHLDEVHRTT